MKIDRESFAALLSSAAAVAKASSIEIGQCVLLSAASDIINVLRDHLA